MANFRRMTIRERFQRAKPRRDLARRVGISDDAPLVPWLKELRDQWFAMRDYEHTPLLKIQEWIGLPHGVPLFDSVLTFDRRQMNTSLRALGVGWLRREVRTIQARTNYGLTLAGYGEDSFLLSIRYDTGRFDEPLLAFLDAQLFPEWVSLLTTGTPSRPTAATAPPERPDVNYWLPESAEERRAGFYVCSQMLQLMEDVYLEFTLDRHFDHIDNRGWMNLFQHWAWSGMLCATWAMTGSTFDPRFQRFCWTRLELRPGRPSVARLSAVPGRPLLADSLAGFSLVAGWSGLLERAPVAGVSEPPGSPPVAGLSEPPVPSSSFVLGRPLVADSPLLAGFSLLARCTG